MSKLKEDKGLLVLGYGAPHGLEEIPAFYTSIRRGQRPSDEAIDELRRRYEAIGGQSPLLDISEAQAKALVRRLKEEHGEDFALSLGYLHTEPSIGAAVEGLLDKSIATMYAIVLSPFASTFVMGAYKAQLRGALGPNCELHFVGDWSREEALLSYWKDEIKKEVKPGDYLLFTAHSIPTVAESKGDTYGASVRQFVQTLASDLGLAEDDYSLAWQSASGHGDWIGPSELTALESIDPKRRLVVAPIGFIADHLEVCYDLDTRLQARCEDRGQVYKRLPMPNDCDALVEAMAQAIARA